MPRYVSIFDGRDNSLARNFEKKGYRVIPKKYTQPAAIPSKSIVRNTGYNLLSQGIFVFLAFWAIPILVRGLGEERFGLLALLWVLVGYFSLLDLGISRANVKFLSEAAALGDNVLLSKTVWTSLTASAGFGLVVMVAILGAIPFLLSNVLKVSPSLYQEASQAFFFAAMSLPFMLVFGTIKGVQMAFLRFDLVNLFQGGMTALQWIGSVVLTWYGMGIKEILFLTFLLRVISAVSAFLMLRGLIPTLYQNLKLWNKAVFKKIIRFGGWVTVSQALGPVLMYLDRILIGALVSLAAVAYYSVPQEALGRLIVIPVSLSIVLFPVFSGQIISEESREGIKDLYDRSIRYLAILMLPIAIGILVYAENILTIWVGPQYGKVSTLPFQIMAIGFLFNSLGQVPMTVLHAYNRPDLPAKFYMIELPIMVILNVILIPTLGIVGAAIVWNVRVVLDALLLFVYAHSYISTPVDLRRMVGKIYSVRYEVLFSLAITVVLLLLKDVMIKTTISITMVFCYIPWIWFRNFDDLDRRYFMQLCGRISRGVH